MTCPEWLVTGKIEKLEMYVSRKICLHHSLPRVRGSRLIFAEAVQKNGKRRATGGLDSNLCLGAYHLHNLTSLNLLIDQIIDLNHLSSKIPYLNTLSLLYEYPIFRNDSS